MLERLGSEGKGGGARRRSRREWLAGAAAIWAGAYCLAEEPSPPGPDPEEDREARAIAARAEEAALPPFRRSQTTHYLGLGDASDPFRALTLRDCEAIAADYLDYYRAKGFAVSPPEHRLTVVVLADDRSFAAFCGDRRLLMTPKRNDPDPTVQGMYNRKTNWLQVYDHRSLGPQLGARAGFGNLRSLAHEATHQLTFNTGLLNRRGDIPKCITEGLAMFGEVRKLHGRTPPGQLNRMRLGDLASLQRRRIAWVPVARLLASDRAWDSDTDPHERLFAYAQSWLLVDYLMKEPSRLPGFRTYLAALHSRRDPDARLDDARNHLGDLDRLNQDLQAYAIRLLKTS
jgi:hypothetical protein